MFLAGAMDKVIKYYAFADVKSANAFWRIHFMTRKGEQIYAKFVHIQVYFPCRLGSICMKQNSMPVCDGGELDNRLYHSNLIIGMHYRNQDCLGSDQFFQFINFCQAIFIDRKIRYLKTLFL